MNITRTATPDLNTGDLVLDHGMRIRLGARDTCTGHPAGDVVAFHGVVENYDAAIAADPGLAVFVPDATYRIQGNHLADWSVITEG